MSEPTQDDLNRPLWMIWDSGCNERLLYLYNNRSEAVEYAQKMNAAESREVFSVYPVASNHGLSPDAVIAAARQVVLWDRPESHSDVFVDRDDWNKLKEVIDDYDAAKEQEKS